MHGRQLNRKEKIALLAAISNGQVHAEAITGPRIFFFTERTDRPGILVHAGREYTPEQCADFETRVKQLNPDNVVWHETKTYK